MELDKNKLQTKPLYERISDLSIEEIALSPQDYNGRVSPLESSTKIVSLAENINKSRKNNRPVIVFFGAHLIKNGLGLLLSDLVEKGYITHLATNGAGSIHDWEFAYQGKSTENVRNYVSQGQFGLWEETGKYINLALIQGARRGLGYGESIGELISLDKIIFPEGEPFPVKHPFKNFSVQNAAFKKEVPFTVHPGIGYDIIYTHPLCDGAAIGKTSYKDFLTFANSVSGLEGGVYISIGSAIASPMVFEKSLSMARNIANQSNHKITDFMIAVNDIQPNQWENSNEEPLKDNPAYYARLSKSFNRMGVREMQYIKGDNRDFLVALHKYLISSA